MQLYGSHKYMLVSTLVTEICFIKSQQFHVTLTKHVKT